MSISCSRFFIPRSEGSAARRVAASRRIGALVARRSSRRSRFALIKSTGRWISPSPPHPRPALRKRSDGNRRIIDFNGGFRRRKRRKLASRSVYGSVTKGNEGKVGGKYVFYNTGSFRKVSLRVKRVSERSGRSRFEQPSKSLKRSFQRSPLRE